MTELKHFLFREHIECAVLLHRLQFLQACNTLLDGLEVRHHAAQPTLIHKELACAHSLFLHGLLRLLLRADEEHGLAFLRNAAQEIVSLIHLPHRLLQIDDIDAIALREDVLCHLRVPPARLMSEVDTCLQQLLHRNNCHVGAPPVFSSASFIGRFTKKPDFDWHSTAIRIACFLFTPLEILP